MTGSNKHSLDKASFAGNIWSDQDFAAAEAVIKAVSDKGLETIRIVFVDQHGITRGKTIMASALKSAFQAGVSMTSTLLLKDTSHTTVFPVWDNNIGFGSGIMTGASDFLMLPDPATFKILPWAPTTGWMISDIFQTDGRAIKLSTRQILRKSLERLHAMGLEFVSGLEVEFYVLKIDDPQLAHENANRPEDPPKTSLLTHGYQYLTENRIDQMDNVMELLRVNAVGLGLPLHSMESEFGPSQFEFTFEPSKGMATADLMVLFRNMVKQVCQRNGLHATFMSRPAFKNSMGNGWHLHQSIIDQKTGQNLFIPKEGEGFSPIGEQWIAGILDHAEESCILTTPTINGYKR
jgi:glutamine synthetase